MPETDASTQMKNASDFAGAYADGNRSLEISGRW